MSFYLEKTRCPEVTFIQEPGIDAGALTKEYFSIGKMAVMIGSVVNI